ncbi:MAG: NPCBM/NEW2 domain-containing protein, partial [Clostridia bacterium]|nr:NPCBM/NEW2 domain-containing protein [Clostridia bacterium]
MEKNVRNIGSKIKFLLKIIFSFALLFVVFLAIQNDLGISLVLADNEVSEGTNQSEFRYLSDITPQQASSAWKNVTFNQTSDGALISVKVEGASYTFQKGIWAHATSTVVYD